MAKAVFRSGVASITFAMSLTAGADAGERAWYASVEGGIEIGGGEVSASIVGGPLCGVLFPCAPDTSIDSGLALFGAVGTRVAPNVRLEAEVGHRSQVIGGQNDLTQTTLMANAIYDLPLLADLTLSIGAGVGVDWVNTGAGGIGPLPDGETAFGYQVIAGLSYDLSEILALTVNYRLTQAQFDDLYAEVNGIPASGTFGLAVEDWDTTGTVTVGLRFGF